jgi:hypothetical protein
MIVQRYGLDHFDALWDLHDASVAANEMQLVWLIGCAMISSDWRLEGSLLIAMYKKHNIT